MPVTEENIFTIMGGVIISSFGKNHFDRYVELLNTHGISITGNDISEQQQINMANGFWMQVLLRYQNTSSLRANLTTASTMDDWVFSFTNTWLKDVIKLWENKNG